MTFSQFAFLTFDDITEFLEIKITLESKAYRLIFLSSFFCPVIFLMVVYQQSEINAN